jgi:hypothetical protein
VAKKQRVWLMLKKCLIASQIEALKINKKRLLENDVPEIEKGSVSGKTA